MLPNLIIIGAGKAGTTSLHSYLGAHPEIFMSRRKEIAFFLRDDWDQPEAIAEYEAHFAGADGERYRGESTPMYSQYPYYPDVASRMAAIVPGARLIYVVREPFKRLESAHYEQLMRPRHRTWEQFLADWRSPGDQLFAPTLYASQLKLYLKHFPADQILVLDHENVLRHRDETLEHIFGWLGVDPRFRSPVFVEQHNTRRGKGAPRMPRWLWKGVVHPLSEKVPRRWREPIAGPAKKLLLKEFDDRPVLDERARAEMSEVLEPEVRWLREFTGRDFAHWSI